MTSKELMAQDSQSVMQTYGRFPLAIDHGEGSALYSPEGKRYIVLPPASASTVLATAISPG